MPFLRTERYESQMEQNWLEQFDNGPEELMAHYGASFKYEDMKLGIRIVDNKPALRGLLGDRKPGPRPPRQHFEAARHHRNRRGHSGAG